MTEKETEHLNKVKDAQGSYSSSSGYIESESIVTDDERALENGNQYFYNSRYNAVPRVYFIERVPQYSSSVENNNQDIDNARQTVISPILPRLHLIPSESESSVTESSDDNLNDI